MGWNPPEAGDSLIKSIILINKKQFFWQDFGILFCKAKIGIGYVLCSVFDVVDQSITHLG